METISVQLQAILESINNAEKFQGIKQLKILEEAGKSLLETIKIISDRIEIQSENIKQLYNYLVLTNETSIIINEMSTLCILQLIINGAFNEHDIERYKNGITVMGLSKYFGNIDPSNVVAILKALEKKGKITVTDNGIDLLFRPL